MSLFEWSLFKRKKESLSNSKMHRKPHFDKELKVQLKREPKKCFLFLISIGSKQRPGDADEQTNIFVWNLNQIKKVAFQCQRADEKCTYLALLIAALTKKKSKHRFMVNEDTAEIKMSKIVKNPDKMAKNKELKR